MWLCWNPAGTKTSSWAASSQTETDSSTPLPVLPEGFSQVRFLAIGSAAENENLQIRSQGVVSEPDPGFSPPIQLDLWMLDLIYTAWLLLLPLSSHLLSVVFLYFYLSVVFSWDNRVFFLQVILSLVFSNITVWIERQNWPHSTSVMHFRLLLQFYVSSQNCLCLWETTTVL